MRAIRSLLCLALFCLALGLSQAVAAGARASASVEFREARVRLLLLEPQPGENEWRGGIGIRLMPDYKTYWRSPGDSGVPPTIDLAGSRGVGGFELHFPFPTSFDDGAGGQAWGYKRDVILPFTFRREGTEAPSLKMRLDFAVCDTMCIPLTAELSLERGNPVENEVAEAVRRAHAVLPKKVEASAVLLAAQRLPSDGKPRFALNIRHEAPAADFSLFPEGKGYFHVEDVVQKAPGLLEVRLKGRPAPGAGGQFGPVRITFGTKKQPFESVIDLDGLPASP